MKRYKPTDEVDFAIVGSGAAGGVMARQLAQAGFSVVVLEQGPWRTNADFKHDEFWVNFQGGLEWLKENGVSVVDLHSQECIDMLAKFTGEHPELWAEDIGE